MSVSKNSFASGSSDCKRARGFFEILFRRSHDKFFHGSRRRGIVIAHGPVTRLRPLLKNALIDNISDLHSLAINHSQSIKAGFLNSDGILKYRQLNQAQRERITSSPLGLFLFNNLDQHFNTLKLLLLQACQNFGYTTHGAHCLGFFHTSKANLPRHCDELDVIVIQLFGRRRWWIERNVHSPEGILDPLRASSLESCAVDPRFGDTTKALDLRPGTVLYVPAGYWHQTYSHTHSFSVTLGLPGPLAGLRLRERRKEQDCNSQDDIMRTVQSSL